MLHRVFPLRSLSAALVLSTSLTVPAFAVFNNVTHPQSPLTGPIVETTWVDIFHSSATVTSTDYGFKFDAGVGTAILFSSGSIVSSGDAFYVSTGGAERIENYGNITSDHDGISVGSGATGSFYNSGIIMGLDSSHGKTVDLDGGVTGTFENAGSIYGANRAIDFDAHVETFINTGDIEADAVFDTGYQFGSGIDANTIGTFSNSGTIWSLGRTIQATGITSFTNSGTIKAANASGGEAVYVGGGVGSFTNSGTIEARSDKAIMVTGQVGTFTNAQTGVIDAKMGGVSFGGTVGSFTNRGTITTDLGTAALFGDDVGNFTNSGSINILSEGSGVRIAGDVSGSFANEAGGTITGRGPTDAAVHIDGTVASFINRGTIQSFGGRAVEAFGGRTETFFNSGSITATDLAVDIGPVGTFTNSATGVIESSGEDAVWFTTTVDSFVNQGRIATTAAGKAGVDLNETTRSFTNSGTISSTGGDGLTVVRIRTGTFVNEASGAITGANYGALFYNGASTFENRGKITGLVGVGFYDSSATASRLINSGTIEGTGGKAIDFGVGAGNNILNDVLELRTGSRILGSVDFAEGSDTLDVSGFRSNAVLTVASLENLTTGRALVNDQRDGSGNGTISVLDATGITQGGSAPLGEVAGAIGDEIAGALGGQAGTFAPTEPMGYAPSRPAGAAEAAADELVATADPTGPDVWGKMFGGIANKSDEYNAVLGGIIAGSHVAVDANTRLGGVVSVSGSRFAAVGGSQTVTGTIGAAGLYGSTDLGGVVVSYSVLGGVAANHSDRTVTAMVTETARADFGSWFWSPEFGLSMPVPLFEGVETDAGFKLRYVGGGVGSYTETGSSQNLSVGTAAVNLLDARVELTSKTQVASNDYGDVMLYGTAGLLAQQNFGGSVAIAGFPIAQTPASFAYGAYADVTLEGPIGPSAKASASTGLELRSDGLSSASANLGLSSTF